jgi:hypothetical protein
VSDALAQTLGLTVVGVLDPTRGADFDKWVIYVPPEHAEAVRTAVFGVGAGQTGDYSCCSWSVAGIGQFLPHDGARPAIGTVGQIERLPEDRVEVIARPGPARGAGGHPRSPPLRGAGLRRHPPGRAARRHRVGPHRRTSRARTLAQLHRSRGRAAARHRLGCPGRW